MMARPQSTPLTTCRVCGEPRFHHPTQRRALCRTHFYEYAYRTKNESRHRKGVQPIARIRQAQAVSRARQEECEARKRLLYAFEQGLYALRRAVCLRDEGCLFESFRVRDSERALYHARYQSDAAFRRQERIRILARKHGDPARQAEVEPVQRWQLTAAAADGSITIQWVREALESAVTCPLCMHAFDWSSRWRTPSLDHLTPISRGGLHSRSNVMIICVSCNAAKGVRTMEEYERRPRKRQPATEAAA